MTRDKFISWVEQRVPSDGNQEFLSKLKRKLNKLNEHDFRRFIQPIMHGSLSDPLQTYYHDSNQTKWNVYSSMIIHDLKNAFAANELDLTETIMLLGNERHHIAQDLGHVYKHREANQFGLLRGVDTDETSVCAEFVNESNDWPQYYLPLEKRIKELFANNELIEYSIETLSNDPNASFYMKMLNLQKTDKQSHLLIIGSKPLPLHSNEMCILAIFNNKIRRGSQIIITYPSLLTLGIKQRLADLQPLYAELQKMNLQNDDDMYLYLKKIGELSYSLYRMMATRRGGASITDWLIRGLAEHKGIELGERNKTNPLSQDFEAFVTTNKLEYGEWFATNAFVNVTLQKNSQSPRNTDTVAVLSEIGFFEKPMSSYFIVAMPSDVRDELQYDPDDLKRLIEADIPFIDMITMQSNLRTELLDHSGEVKHLIKKAHIPWLTIIAMQPEIRSELLTNASDVVRLINEARIPLEDILVIQPDLRTKLLKKSRHVVEAVKEVSFDKLKTLSTQQWNIILTNPKSKEASEVLLSVKEPVISNYRPGSF